MVYEGAVAVGQETQSLPNIYKALDLIPQYLINQLWLCVPEPQHLGGTDGDWRFQGHLWLHKKKI